MNQCVYKEPIEQKRIPSTDQSRYYLFRYGEVSWDGGVTFKTCVYYQIERYNKPMNYLGHIMTEPGPNGVSDLTEIIKWMAMLKAKYNIA